MAYIRVSVHYSLDLKYYEVSEAEVKQRMQALENYGYSSYLEDGQLIVDDEIEIDDEYNTKSKSMTNTTVAKTYRKKSSGC